MLSMKNMQNVMTSEDASGEHKKIVNKTESNNNLLDRKIQDVDFGDVNQIDEKCSICRQNSLHIQNLIENVNELLRIIENFDKTKSDSVEQRCKMCTPMLKTLKYQVLLLKKGTSIFFDGISEKEIKNKMNINGEDILTTNSDKTFAEVLNDEENRPGNEPKSFAQEKELFFNVIRHRTRENDQLKKMQNQHEKEMKSMKKATKDLKETFEKSSQCKDAEIEYLKEYVRDLRKTLQKEKVKTLCLATFNRRLTNQTSAVDKIVTLRKKINDMSKMLSPIKKDFENCVLDDMTQDEKTSKEQYDTLTEELAFLENELVVEMERLEQKSDKKNKLQKQKASSSNVDNKALSTKSEGEIEKK